jgi:hypothetical protein
VGKLLIQVGWGDRVKKMKNNLQAGEQLEKMSKSAVYDATIHWCISFVDNIALIDINKNTPCTLLGTVEWHDLNKIVNDIDTSAGFHPQIAAIEEKVVLLEDGIPCTLKQLEEGSVKARLVLEFSLPHSDKEVFRDSSWSDIDQLPIVEMVKAIQVDIISQKTKATRIVRLACGRAQPGPFRQRSLKYKAALAIARGVSLDEIPQKMANRYLVKDILNKKEYLKFGARTQLSLQTDAGELVGCHISHLC